MSIWFMRDTKFHEEQTGEFGSAKDPGGLIQNGSSSALCFLGMVNYFK
jgi:hypothetical protein